MGAAVCIVVSMLCVDIPFVIVRLWTMIEFGLIVSDLIHPLKNIAMICFGLTQLTIIYSNRKAARGIQAAKVFHEQRTLLSPLQDTWDFSKSEKRLPEKRGSSVGVAEDSNDTHTTHGDVNGDLDMENVHTEQDVTVTDIN